MSYILGVSISHDASACLMKDGKILYAIQEERVSRVKHDGTRSLSQTKAIEYCLQAAGITIDDVELIVLNGQQLTYGFTGLSVPWPDADFTLFDPFSEKCLYIPHHLAHAFSAFGPSPYESAAVMVVDGMGSNTPHGQDYAMTGPEMYEYLTASSSVEHKSECESYYQFENGTFKLLERLHSPSFNIRAGSNAVGEAYAAISQYIFGDWRESSKVMALASLGDANRYPWKIIELTEAGPRLNRNWQIQFHHPNRWPENQQEYADLAARIQADLEEYLVWRAKNLAERTGETNLCLAGGVILNVPGNQKIIESGAFQQVYMQPAAHDAGISIGCAYYGKYYLTGSLYGNHVRNDFHGRTYEENEILAVLEQEPRIRFRKSNDVIHETAQLLADQQVICWFQGGSEFGPRALGHRSILGSPLRADVKNYINSSVKYRELFRPLAPSILGDLASTYFQMQEERDECAYMLRAIPIREEYLKTLHEVSHVDGTARVQTVYQADNPLYYSLIQAFYEVSGLPIVLNTSFNTKGQPIVETPKEAVDTFLMMNLDYLVIGEYIVSLANEGMTEKAVPMWNHDCKLLHERQGGEEVYAVENHRKRFMLNSQRYGLLLRIDGKKSMGDLLQEIVLDDQEEFKGLIKTLLDKRVLIAC